MIDSQMDDMIRNRNALKQEIDSLKPTLCKQVKEKELLLQTFIKAQRIKPTLYDGIVISKKHDVIFVVDEEETLILKEESRSKMLAKQNDPISKEKKINISLINYNELNKLAEDFGKCFVPQMQMSVEQAFWLPLSNPKFEQLDIIQTLVEIEVPKELPKLSLVKTSFQKLRNHFDSFDKVVKVRTTPDAITEGSWDFENVLHSELNEVKTVFNQMEAVVEQCSIDKKYSDIQKKELSLDNDRILDHIICQDMMYIVMHADSVPANVLPTDNKCLVNDNLEIERLEQENDHLFELLLSQDIVHICVNSLASRNDYCEIQQGIIDEYNENLMLKAELAKRDKWLKRNFLMKLPINNQNALEILEFFKINEWQARLDAKDVSIANLRKHIESFKGKSIVEKDVQPHNPNEHADTLRKIVEHARELRPLDSDLDFACKVVQIVLWYLDFGFSKHMIGNRSQLINFVHKFMGTVRFRNDQIAKIMGYGDHQIGKVVFRKHTCYILDLEGVDLLKGSRGLNFYTLSLEDMMLSSPICLLSKASKTKSWLWHRRGNSSEVITYVLLVALGKSKKHSHKPKAEDSIQEKLYVLHMDLCGPMRIQSINGRKYLLVIVDEYSRFTWVKFLRSKDEVPEFIITFLKMIQLHLNATVRNIKTDNGTEFVNQTLRAYYEDVRISHQTSIAHTPQQNDVVEIRNRTLLEAARTMLIFSKALLFLWAEKPDLSYLHVFVSLCYPTNDSEHLGKVKPKEDIEIFVGYAPTKKAFQIYNKRIYVITKTIHVEFDELTAMPSEQFSSGPEPQLLCNLCPFLCFEYSNLVLRLFDVC
ncbi:retrovirus-related pol polyprotein from transposon TNT 1-94 [Tanacetum coccineum]